MYGGYEMMYVRSMGSAGSKYNIVVRLYVAVLIQVFNPHPRQATRPLRRPHFSPTPSQPPTRTLPSTAPRPPADPPPLRPCGPATADSPASPRCPSNPRSGAHSPPAAL